MRYLRQLRYWIGYRLLRPHLDRYWRHYNEMNGPANDSGEQARRNCAYIAIGLHYAAGQNERRESAKHPTTWTVK